ncbi:MAG: hypothetical protein U0K86_12530 [Agathobacter sp.]|nr:hypothetical protein [Agathobacter sp.]
MRTEEEFKQALHEKKVPLLVLDQKWHRLFAIHGKTDEIKETEEELNGLLARQGKLNSEVKDLKKLKNTLMNNIMENMDDSISEAERNQREKKLEEDKRLIEEINEKISNAEDELLDLPNIIKECNEELMLLSMDYFYSKLRVNQQEAKEIEDWITQVRIDLKKNIIKKQNREINNREIYAYLHDILGNEVIDIFDIQYDDSTLGEKES